MGLEASPSGPKQPVLARELADSCAPRGPWSANAAPAHRPLASSLAGLGVPPPETLKGRLEGSLARLTPALALLVGASQRSSVF